ncbi:hypothetical protein QBC40DRAFT_299118 [Triangularia verruculosa]|uniref:Uncharacterized protein n=1 Tax=Triangularia verruculosa TaxID=2587418 RepID=A0AAN6XCP9_9PEZI|nr:hypothetical protein QBC40DRAFT_299118 [Triangularia verruculosa]
MTKDLCPGFRTGQHVGRHGQFLHRTKVAQLVGASSNQVGAFPSSGSLAPHSSAQLGQFYPWERKCQAKAPDLLPVLLGEWTRAMPHDVNRYRTPWFSCADAFSSSKSLCPTRGTRLTTQLDEREAAGKSSCAETGGSLIGGEARVVHAREQQGSHGGPQRRLVGVNSSFRLPNAPDLEEQERWQAMGSWDFGGNAIHHFVLAVKSQGRLTPKGGGHHLKKVLETPQSNRPWGSWSSPRQWRSLSALRIDSTLHSAPPDPTDDNAEPGLVEMVYRSADDEPSSLLTATTYREPVVIIKLALR